MQDLKNFGLREKDIVVGISAAGGAAYVIEALQYAKSIGCKTVGITSNAGTLLDKTPDISIVTRTGPEVITGSMIKMGYVYENLMINLSATNEKLYGRMKRIVSDILQIPHNEAEQLLVTADWNIKRAILLYKEGAGNERE